MVETAIGSEAVNLDGKVKREKVIFFIFLFNLTTMFVRKQGKTKFMWLPVTASTAISAGALVAYSSGKLIAATATSVSSDIPGVIRHTIASTDSDYTTARLVEVEVPVEKNTVWEGDVTSGLVVGDIGLYQDLTDSLTVDRAASIYDITQCVKVISTTKGWFVLNVGPDARAKA